MDIPSRVLKAAGDPGGGQLVIVMGAGCSIEAPTCLPDSKRCSRELWQELVDDEVLSSGECLDPDDLSSVADAVYARYESQAELVARLKREFWFAEPNEGSVLAAALLREGVAHHVVTLNIDLTMSSALVQVGTDAGIRVISRPEDHGQMGARNLVYLHRNVQAEDPDSLVLRTAALNEQWKAGWEEVIAHIALSTPVVVFAGLGTEVGVLMASALRMKAALGDTVTIVQVDVGSREDSAYATELEIDEANFISAPWTEFMRRLGERVSRSQSRALEKASLRLTEQEEVPAEDAASLAARLADRGLLYLGELRASWTLDQKMPYRSAHEVNDEHLADLLLGIAMLERLSGCQAHFVDGGLMELRREGANSAMIAVGSGEGVSAWLTAEERLRRSRNAHSASALRPIFGVLAHVKSRPEDVAPPPKIIPERKPANLVTATGPFPIFALEELRANPSAALELLSAA